MKRFLSILSIFLFSNLVYGQQTEAYFQGYAQEISGKRFGYHSPLPDVNTSLLLRGQADYAPLEWETETIPANYDQKEISFIWLFGMDVSSSPADIHLSVNDQTLVVFSNSKTSTLGVLSYKGKEESELKLNVTMLDKYQDQMGIAILTIPTRLIEKGQPARMKLSSSTTDNAAWFMTFKTKLEESINVYQNKVVAKRDGQLFHSVSFDVTHLGVEAETAIKIGDVVSRHTLKPGFNKIEIYLPKVEQETTFTAEIQTDNKGRVQKTVTLQPVRTWEIYLVQHTHTDIGYTRPQTEILAEHLRYIDHALDFCDQTDDYPDAAKFRWTCETSWSIREYLKSRPQAQIDRLLQRLKEGRIEATGMFLNYSEIIDEPALAAQTKTLRFLKDEGVHVTTAMQNDVNGIAWSLVDLYHNTSVKYLNMGLHAHRARKPFNKPTSFWWQSPAGKRLLAYRSEHYQFANSLGIASSQQDILRNNLSKYLMELEGKNYPYSKVSLQFSGYVTDNSPPSVKACDIIKEWNEKYEWPKLRSALASDFMSFLEEEHADELPKHPLAWPDWWTDGVGSAANETKQVRQTHVNISAITALLSMGKMMGAEIPDNIHDDITEVYDNLLFYDEHTHGAAESISDPLAQNTVNQWAMKSAYAWEAAKQANLLEEKALALLEPVLDKSNKPSIAVFNTLNWPRSGLVQLFIQNAFVPEGADFTITDAEGNEVPYQRGDQRMEGAYFELWATDIPAMGYKTFHINLGEKPEIPSEIANNTFQNQYYRLSIDEKKGVVTSIFDKELKKELIDPQDTLTLGQFIYEQLGNRHQLERLTNTNRDTVYQPLDLTRTQLKNIKVVKIENGTIYQSILLNGDMPVCADERGVTIEIRLHHHQKKIEFLYRMIKLPNTSPEAVYVAFPFYLENGQLAFEAQGGVVYPGINQLEGSSADWNTIQNFAAVRNEDAQILLVSDEIPLVQFGDINTGRYYYRLKPKTNHIYSWVLNNYWVTNFKASQEGELRWSYSITSAADNSDTYATQFGWGERVPLKSRVLFPTKDLEKSALTDRSFINIDVPNLLLVNATPSLDGQGIILLLRELEGDHAILDVGRLMEETGATAVYEVNVLEEELKTLTRPVLIEHFETMFVKLDFVRE
jgi:alpha-mannosidase